MIPFNKPFLVGSEIAYIQQAHDKGQLAGDGFFTKKCHAWFENYFGCQKALLTHSCTAALEIAALLLDLKPGDEVIMPSYTFVSTANAFALRGAIPVFVDVDPATLNISPKHVKKAITCKTKAIVPVHYAGVSCDMNLLISIAREHSLFVVEDAAQGLLSSYCNRPVGTYGDLSCFSFHETKNIISGEGGALIINNPNLADRAEIIREKGTDRSQFFRGQVDKYSWVDLGSSYLPGELIAAFLWAQLEKAQWIISKRLALWEHYDSQIKSYGASSVFRTPSIPDDCEHNGHMYYLIANSFEERQKFISYMKLQQIQCVFHYVPLHSSSMGMKISRTSGTMEITQSLSSRLVRLPLWIGLNTSYVLRAIHNYIN